MSWVPTLVSEMLDIVNKNQSFFFFCFFGSDGETNEGSNTVM